jgi:hypothetical protein
MSFNKFLSVGLLALAPLAASAAVTCTKTFDLGSMGPPATKSFASGYFTAANFADCYNFSINAPADSTGTTTEWNWNFAGLLGSIDVWGVQLLQGTTTVGAFDNSPESFAFGNLSAGAYQLVVTGQTTRGSLTTLVAYSGTLSTTAAPVAAPVPEPELYAMLALGFAGAAWVSRRRKA